MVLIIVRYGHKNIKIMYIIASLCVVWGVSVLLTIQYQVPQVYAVGFLAGAVCFPDRDDTIFLEAHLFFTVLIIFITTLLPLTVCIAMPILVFRYTKKHSITGSIDYGKAAAKLCLFLLTGVLMNSTVTIVTNVLAFFSSGSGTAALYIYIPCLCHWTSVTIPHIHTRHHFPETSARQAEGSHKVFA